MMQLLSKQLEGQVKNSSMIRKMFEQGIELRKKFGADAVCDFSLGNPDLTPPPAIIDAMKELCETVARPAGLGYMPNAGYPDVRQALAEHLTVEQQTAVGAEHVVVTVGAAGGLNAFLLPAGAQPVEKGGARLAVPAAIVERAAVRQQGG